MRGRQREVAAVGQQHAYRRGVRASEKAEAEQVSSSPKDAPFH
jgi:hypothetical protein